MRVGGRMKVHRQRVVRYAFLRRFNRKVQSDKKDYLWSREGHEIWCVKGLDFSCKIVKNITILGSIEIEKDQLA